jgi:ABC-type transport system involved in cytochrome bd biosynthesis fused ATPase/permease subunit
MRKFITINELTQKLNSILLTLLNNKTMATTISNLAPSQTNTSMARTPKSPTQNMGNAFKQVSKSTKKNLTSLLARVLFRQPNFNFLDIPTANLNMSQQEMIDDLTEKTL